MAKTKEPSKDTRNKIVDLHQAGKTDSAKVSCTFMATLSANSTLWLGLQERVAGGTSTTFFCLIFLFINSVMLFTLGSKRVFRETSRYILLSNLLLGDTLQLVISQLLYLLSASRVTLTYPLCGVIVMLTKLFSRISPLVLVVMSLERYVAVCHPLRHASIITSRNTVGTVLAAWVFCFLNVLIQGLLLLMFPFDQLESLQMSKFCSFFTMLVVPISEVYFNIYTYFLFISASLTIVFSYVGVIVSARSAATDKDSARKARDTLLLHLAQLGLSLLSVFYTTLLLRISTVLSHMVFVQLQSTLFVCLFLLPRCLSSLVYGLRDQSLRVVFMYHLFCHLKVSVTPVKAAFVS
ncbi:odorant receptor 131-2-like isoform X1 [Syngnathoides biaculeatus]|uniref:odorant receptor 131-2-like isoform X1 n=1 Tax=Syngnathoides biaculeatus TaxID=300417 RepID=UPI002ADDE332|nr:odorant receptor 131-2-like isoform X1 [Syngnathoides biaculeatus]